MSDDIIETTQEELSRLDKVKKHIKTHQTKYLVGGAVVVTAVVTHVVTTRYVKITINTIDGDVFKVNPRAYFSKQTVVVIKKVVRQGPPGIRVRDLLTGEEWDSQELAAKAIGVTKHELSKYLNDPTKTWIKSRQLVRTGELAMP